MSNFKKSIKNATILSSMAIMFCGVSNTSAGSQTANFGVTASVVASCTIAASNLAFGNYSGALINATSTITVNCGLLVPYKVGLSAGNGPNATTSSRKMTGSPATNTLAYSLSRDSAHTLNWGNNFGVDTQAGIGTGLAQVLTVYGQIPANETAATGAYTDTIVATIST